MPLPLVGASHRTLPGCSHSAQAGTLLIFLVTALEFGGLRLNAQQAHRTAGAQKPSAAVERGRQQFLQTCAFCHGPDATGGRGPDLLRSPLVAHDVKGEIIGQVIRNGRPQKGMPPFHFGDSVIADIAAFLHFRAREALHSGSVGGSCPLSRLLTGNAEAGKAYFVGPGGCTSCHSAAGDLKRIAQKYPPIDLEARMLYPPDAHSTATVTLPSGRQVKGQVLHLDDFSVALRDASGWYHSFRRDQAKVDVVDPLAAHRELLDRLTGAEMHNLFAYLETLK